MVDMAALQGNKPHDDLIQLRNEHLLMEQQMADKIRGRIRTRVQHG